MTDTVSLNRVQYPGTVQYRSACALCVSSPGMFFDAAAAARLKHWRYDVEDRSISTKMLTPYWNMCASMVPDCITPNVLTLASATSNIMSGFSSVAAACEGPTSMGASYALLAAFFAFSGQTLDAIDGKHARKTGQCSPLGELWDHSLDATSGPFVAIMAGSFCVGMYSTEALWLCVLAFTVAFRAAHADALLDGVCKFLVMSSGEAGLLIDMLLVVRAYRGNRGILPLTWHAHVAGDWGILTDPEQVEFALILLVLIPLASDLLLVLWRGLRHDDESKRTSCCRLMLCSVLDVSAVVYGYLHVPARPFAPGAWSISQFGPLLSVTLVGSISTVDSIMAKMSGRRLLPRVVPLTAALLGLSLVDGGWPYAICATLAYHLLAICAVCDALHLPLLGHVTTVFVDGVYDMCHLGHLNILRRAAEHGDRLIVGLGTDECCSLWKRPPIMSFAERRATLLALPWVSGVIPIDRFDCEFSAAFLEEHHVDVLCYGEEYDPVLNPEFAKRVASGMAPDFYRVARTGGVTGRREQAAERRESRARAVVLPRTAGVSTSEIIQRLAARIEQDKGALMKRNDGGSADKKNV